MDGRSVPVSGVRRRSRRGYSRRLIDALVGQIVRDDRLLLLLLVADLLVMIAIALALGVVSGVALALDSTVGRARPARPARRVTAGRIAERGTVHAGLALGRHFFCLFFFIFFIFVFGHILGGRKRIRTLAFDGAESGNARTSRALAAKDRDVRRDRFVLLRWCRSHSADECL